jgi:hypothetical protein
MKLGIIINQFTIFGDNLILRRLDFRLPFIENYEPAVMQSHQIGDETQINDCQFWL